MILDWVTFSNDIAITYEDAKTWTKQAVMKKWDMQLLRHQKSKGCCRSMQIMAWWLIAGNRTACYISKKFSTGTPSLVLKGYWLIINKMLTVIVLCWWKTYNFTAHKVSRRSYMGMYKILREALVLLKTPRFISKEKHKRNKEYKKKPLTICRTDNKAY